MVALTASGLYPVSMVGNGTDRFSNMSPPTLAIVALTFWLVGLTMVVRPAVSRWLANPRPWMAVIAANQTCMTVYLWHLTATMVSAVILVRLGVHALPLNPLLLPIAFATLAGLVAVFRGCKAPPARSPAAEGGRVGE